MRTCPYCDTQNSDQAYFCRACGSELIPQSTPVETQPAPVPDAEPLQAPIEEELPDTRIAGIQDEVPGSPEPESTPAPAPPQPGQDLPTTRPDELPLPRPDYIPSAEPEASAPPAPPPDEPTKPAAPATPKNRNLALIIEVAFGLFGFLGIGWIYSGRSSVGIGLLAASVALIAVFCAVTILSSGVTLLCGWPILWIAIAVSAYYLYRYTKQHPETFGA